MINLLLHSILQTGYIYQYLSASQDGFYSPTQQAYFFLKQNFGLAS